MEIFVPELVRFASCACHPLLGYVSEFFKLRKNFKMLQLKMGKLERIKKENLDAVNTARLEGSKLTAQASKWIKEAEDFQREADPMMTELSDGFDSEGCSLKFFTVRRCRLRKAVIKKLDEVDRLISSGYFQIEPINGQSFTKAVEWMPTIPLDGQAMAEKQLQQLMEFSNAEKISVIAVWGMAGVGKTTLVKNFNNRLKSSSDSKLFDMVIWVHEARDLDVESVQSHIAKRMNYKLDAEDSTQRRAGKLCRRLLKFKQVLIIFDDIWEKIDLETVGIPKCCKVLLITRSYTVCREMDTDADIKVDVLNENAAWELFVRYAGPVVQSERINPSAKQILRKCGGLPLAIKTIGRSMANKAEIALWKNAVNQLCRDVPHLESFEKDVLLTLQLSINNLPQVYRSCLQYCSLYPENFSIKINELINCWYADVWIDEHASLDDILNSGIATVEYLKEACMLEYGEVIGTVKLHGLLRDAAIKVFSQETECGFVCQPATSLLEVQEKLKVSSCTRMSLMDNLNTKLPCLQGFSESTVFFLQNNPIRSVPDEVFRELKALKLLNLSGTSITSLPDSIDHLTELRVFLMRDCHSLKSLPPFGGLLNIRILDLSGTRLHELPKELGKLTSLISLDLSSTSQLKSIELGIISGLCSIQSLDMSHSAYKWHGKQGVEDQSSSIHELMSLEHLSNLRLMLDPEIFTNEDYFLSSGCYTLFDRLRKFTVWVSPKRYKFNVESTQESQDDDKKIIFKGVDMSSSGIEAKALLSYATTLALSTCGCINFLFMRRNITCLFNLKSLQITSCLDVRNLVDVDGIGQSMPPNLEHLELIGLQNLETILSGTAPDEGIFKLLKTLKVVECHKLKNLVPYSLLLHLQSIESITVSDCRHLESVFAGNSNRRVPRTAIPNLRFLRLENLVSLKHISSRPTRAWQNLEKLEVSNCPELRKLPFTAHNVGAIKEIKGDRRWWNNIIWRDDENEIRMILQKRFKECHDHLTSLKELMWGHEDNGSSSSRLGCTTVTLGEEYSDDSEDSF